MRIYANMMAERGWRWKRFKAGPGKRLTNDDELLHNPAKRSEEMVLMSAKSEPLGESLNNDN